MLWLLACESYLYLTGVLLLPEILSWQSELSSWDTSGKKNGLLGERK